MAAGVGHSKITSNGLVFAYDQGDTFNSYKGEPTTNICDGTAYSIYNSGATNYRNNTEVSPLIPGFEVVKVVADTLGTYGQSILWKAGYSSAVVTITNSVYAYLTAGSYVQVGQHWWPWYYGTAKYIPKNQWVRISETYTINEGNSYGTAAMVYSTDGIAYFTMPQYEIKTHATPFITYNGTRSNTGALLDLSNRGNTIDLVNMSYDSNAQPYFDGTDDYTDVTSNLGTLSEYTIEHVSYKGAENKMPISYRGGPIFYQYGDNSWYYTHGGVAGEYYYPKTVTINGWGHWTIVYNGSYVRIYRNGVYEGQQATSGTADWTNGMRIGRYGPYGYNWNGQIAVVKMYNRALSDSEVSQNYNHYKTRFNLS